MTTECWQRAWDLGLARKYTWGVNFTTPLAKSWLSKVETLLKTSLLPDFDLETGAIGVDILKLDVETEYKKNDKAVDITFITDKGTSKFLDVALTTSPVLRQLRMESTVSAMIANNILRKDCGCEMRYWILKYLL